MKKLDEPILVAIACAVIAMFVSGIAVLTVISLTDFNITSIVRMSPADDVAKLAREIDPSFQLVAGEAHYDGVYYYAIALDPLATKEAHQLIDLSAYRYSHAGFGWAAWLMSFGQPSLVPGALLGLGLASVGAASAIASVISSRLGWTPWAGLLVGLNPGVIYAVSADTGEPFALVLLGLLILCWWKRRWAWAGALGVALCLTKEMFLFVCAGLFVWTLLEMRRNRTREGSLGALAAASVGPLSWILWQVYLFTKFEEFSLSEVPKSFYVPFAGWIESLSIAGGLSLSTADSTQVGQVSVPLIVAIGALLAIGIYMARRMRTEIEAIFLFLAVFAFCWGPYQLVYPKELLRLAATPLILLPALIGSRRDERAP